MRVKKYDGVGNNFVILPFEEGEDYSKLAQTLCQEFATDGLIAVKENPLEMVYYNQDGSQASMCGNGIRCFAKYCLDENIASEENFDVETLAGTMKIQVISKNPYICSVNMGQAKFGSDYNKMSVEDTGKHIIEVDKQKIELYTVFMGTVHTVVFVDDAKAMLESNLGEIICNHPLFKEKTNVNFVEVNSRTDLTVRTYERGVGWTLACGTGCCAASVIANKLGLADETVTIHLERGQLTIENKETVFMSGPATFEIEREIV